MPNKTILDYLKQNNISDTTKFSLQDDGDGVYIKVWNYSINKPTLPSAESIALTSSINKKISQLKTNLELENNKPCLVKVGDVEFLIKKEDEITIGRRIKRLSGLPSGSTAEWSNSSNERLNLTLPQFEELLRTLENHLDVRDEQNFAIYFPIKEEIEAALTVEEANTTNINFN